MEFVIGTLPLLLVLTLILACVRKWATRELTIKEVGIVDWCMIGGLCLRTLWAIIVIVLSDHGYCYLVYDDQTYHEVAMGLQEARDDNAYYSFLTWVYAIFGRSSMNGRLINLFMSLMAIYPTAIIEKSIITRTNFRATKLASLSPFMVFCSFFEIKDIILLFTFTGTYATLKLFEKKHKKRQLLLLTFFCVISEMFRSGMGILPIGILIFKMLIKGIGQSRFERFFSAMVGLMIGIGAIFYVGSSYLLEAGLQLDRYQRWIFTQFSESSIYNQFVITDISGLWKLPFCFLLYMIQPLNALDGTQRFFSEFGAFAKLLDVAPLLIAILFMPRFIRREKWDSLLLFIPLSFVSAINLTNSRQGYFLYPLLYISYAMAFDPPDTIRHKNLFASIYNNPKLIWYGQYIFTFFWIILMVYRNI